MFNKLILLERELETLKNKKLRLELKLTSLRDKAFNTDERIKEIEQQIRGVG